MSLCEIKCCMTWRHWRDGLMLRQVVPETLGRAFSFQASDFKFMEFIVDSTFPQIVYTKILGFY